MENGLSDLEKIVAIIEREMLAKNSRTSAGKTALAFGRLIIGKLEDEFGLEALNSTVYAEWKQRQAEYMNLSIVAKNLVAIKSLAWEKKHGRPKSRRS